MKIAKDDFQQTLRSVQAGLARREDRDEQSSCFCFDAGFVTTFNDEVACRAPSGLPESFTGAVPAEPLLNLLDKFRADDLRLELSGGEFLISGKRRDSGLRVEQEVLLPYDRVVDPPEDWSPLHEDFLDALGIVQECAGSDDANQFCAACVHIHPKFMEACDHAQMARYKLRTGVREEILVRKEAIKCVATLSMTEVCETKSWIHFRSPTGLLVSCRRYLENYEDLSHHMEMAGDPVTLPSGLEEALQAADIFSRETDAKLVTVELDRTQLRVKSMGASGWYRERLPLDGYSGEPLSFLISPNLLLEISKRFNECRVTPDRLIVDGGKWRYVSRLNRPEDMDSEGKEEEVPEDE